MRLVRYIPGPRATHGWTYTEVEMPDDGRVPTHYRYGGVRCDFGTTTLQELVTSGRWQLEIDPDLLIDEGL